MNKFKEGPSQPLGPSGIGSQNAARLRVSKITIYRQMRKGKFAPAIRGIGRSLRWDATTLENWITPGERK